MIQKEIENSKDIQDIAQPLEGNYFLSRHIQRNDPKVKLSKVPPLKAVKTRAQNILHH